MTIRIMMLAALLASAASCIAQISQTPQAGQSYITGRVTYSTDGGPAENIEVWARRINHAELQGQMERRDRTFYKTVTAMDGRYRIDGLQPGRYVVWLFRGKLGEASKWAKNWAVRKHEVVVPADGLEKVDLQLIKGSLIRGRVVSQATGKPVAGQYIGLFDSQESYRYVVTKTDGTFQFRVVEGLQHLWLHDNDASPPRGYQLPKQDTFDFTVENGRTHWMKMQLPTAPPAILLAG